jgi:glycosyltransferase involved in cell wall biosynthesis
MTILYLLTSPPPILEGTDAVVQEVDALQRAFGGARMNLFPFKRLGSRFPRRLFGLHMLGKLRALQRGLELNHIYHPILYPFPVLRLLRNPIVYTVIASLQGSARPAHLAQLREFHRIVVASERDARILADWGLRNVSIVPPGIETSVAPCQYLPLERDLVLLMASAPWARHQFDLKGVDALLEAAKALPYVKLILLWRGVLFDDLMARIRSLGIEQRVEIINEHVDVNIYLARAHATVLVAKRGDVVKSYPHSLVESLLAGRPVIISASISMADDIVKSQAGVVVESVSTVTLIEAIERLRSSYPTLAANAARVGPATFSMPAFVDNYRRVYSNNNAR